MPPIETVKTVQTIRKYDLITAQTQLHYTFSTDGVPGHNTYKDIPGYRISGIPRDGALAEFLGIKGQFWWKMTDQRSDKK